MTHTKEKISDNTQVNFNHSKEVAYWARIYNVSPSLFHKAFEQSGYSIPKTLQLLQQKPA
jgi:AraC-like DNA-binding protein